MKDILYFSNWRFSVFPFHYSQVQYLIIPLNHTQLSLAILHCHNLDYWYTIYYLNSWSSQVLRMSFLSPTLIYTWILLFLIDISTFLLYSNLFSTIHFLLFVSSIRMACVFLNNNHKLYSIHLWIRMRINRHMYPPSVFIAGCPVIPWTFIIHIFPVLPALICFGIVAYFSSYQII